jgi:hypothetical protein
LILIVVNIFTKKLLTLIAARKTAFTRGRAHRRHEGDTSIPKVDYRERIIKRIFRFETTVDDNDPACPRERS